jgi:hypothetical protein
MKKLGTINHGIIVSDEYSCLAKQDEHAAMILKENNQFRHSIYFFIQAMEKHIKAKIFRIVNPNLKYYREKNKTHSLTDAIEFLIEISSNDDNIRKQVKTQLDRYVFDGINFAYLHNNVRYPSYNPYHNNYSIIEYDKNDCLYIEELNNKLKQYLSELYLIKGS